jgi:hypothetical protein
MRKVNPIRLIIGIVLIVVGAVWFLQGIGLFKGSSMTGSAVWLVIGAIAFVFGLLIILQPGRRERAD